MSLPRPPHEESLLRRGRAVPLTVLAATLFLLTSASPAVADTPSDDLGRILWPPEEHRDFAALADLGASVYANDTTPVQVGVQPVESFGLDPLNDTATRVSVGHAGGPNVSFAQGHEARTSAEDSHVSLRVPPARLQQVVEIRARMGSYPQHLLFVAGPPGALQGTADGNGTSGDRAETMRDLARGLGFPEDVSVNPHVGVRDAALEVLFLGRSGCLTTGDDGVCEQEATFRIECPNCSVGAFWVPGLDDEFEAAFPDGPDVETRLNGGGLVLFDRQGQVIATRISHAFDLNESAVLDPSVARSQAADDLRDRGHGLDEEAPDREGRLGTKLAPDAVEVERVEYTWRFHVVRGNTSDPNWTVEGDEAVAEVVQDAWTGRVLSVSYVQVDGSDGPGDADDERPWGKVPAPGAFALLSLAGAAVLVGRSR